MTFGIVECDADVTPVIHYCARVFVKLVTAASEEGAAVIQSIDRAIRVLTALQGARRMSLSELAARLELAPVDDARHRPHAWSSTAWSCRSAGRAATSSGRPCCGSATSTSTPSSCGRRRIPWAEDLARRTGLAVRTGVLLIDDVVIIHHEPRPDGSRQMPEVGIVIPVHASALGKAMLAFLPEDEKRVLASEALRSMTGETLTSPDDLREQLDEVRSSGIAVEQDEAVLGESALASPVFDSYGEAVGAIGVVIPSGVGLESDEARDAVRETARALSRELGAQAWPPRPPTN